MQSLGLIPHAPLLHMKDPPQPSRNLYTPHEAINTTSQEVLHEARESAQVSQEAPHNSRDAATNTTSHEIIRNPQEISHTPHKAANATPQEDSHKTFREAASTHAFQGKSRENPAHISHTSRELSPDITLDASRETSCDPDASPISCDHPITIPLAIQLVYYYSQ
ncbi:hypothetical protein BJX99DRAFT_100953 [Aspergillus californicus]